VKTRRWIWLTTLHQKDKMKNFSHSSRNILNNHTVERFTGDTLFDNIARTVCQAECMPRKELYEAWETARRVRRVMRGGHIMDLAAGHGLVAAILILLDDSSEAATCIDIKQPPSHERVMSVLEDRWPRIKGRIRFVESRIEDAEVPSGCLLVSVHACGVLTDQVLDLALKTRNRVAVLPCCHDLRECDTGSLAGWMDGPLAVDATRVSRLRQAGYKVQTAQIPEDITPKNRLLMGWPQD